MNDKAYHMAAGFIITILVAWLTHNVIIGFTSSLVIGVAKEIYDYYGHGTSELNDIIATAQGGAIGLIILTVMDLGVW